MVCERLIGEERAILSAIFCALIFSSLFSRNRQFTQGLAKAQRPR